MTRSLVLLVLVPIVAGAVAFWVAYFVFYRGGYEPLPPVELPVQGPASGGVQPANTTDTSTQRVRKGLVLVDRLHGNRFVQNELLALQTRVTDRGYEMGFFDVSYLRPGTSRADALEASLREADSFVVMLPEAAYPAREAAIVERFVEKGGKLLLIADPERPHQTNSLAETFGLKFQPDYLYNQLEHDLNFRNILVRDFQPDEITAGLGSITLHGVGSIESSGSSLAFGDANTQSSLVASVARHSPIARGSRRNVLAVADFTFMVPPQDSLLDNGMLLSNIADFLTASERHYELADFPQFYKDGLDVLVSRPTLINMALELKNTLSSYGQTVQITGVEDISRDTIFLGLYEDAPQVSSYLQSAGVRIDEMLGTPFAPELDLSGTAVTVLDENQDRQVVLVMADEPETLADAVARLVGGEFRSDLLSDNIGVWGAEASIPPRPE